MLFAVQQQVHLADSYSEMIARINTAPVKKSQSIRSEELIAAKERELAKISRYKQSIYNQKNDILLSSLSLSMILHVLKGSFSLDNPSKPCKQTLPYY